MEELVKMLIDAKAIQPDREGWRVDHAKVMLTSVPSTLTGIIEARLDRLTQPERRSLLAASVIGVRFWDKAVAFIEPLADRALVSLVERELIEAREPRDADPAPADAREYVFRHQILHQVAYDTILKSRRRSAHAKAAEWFASATGARINDFVGVAAEHYERAGDARNACEYFIRAAERAAATFANEASLAYVARGLALTPADDLYTRWRLLASRERTLNLQGRRTEQRADIDALTQLAESLDDDGLRGLAPKLPRERPGAPARYAHFGKRRAANGRKRWPHRRCGERLEGKWIVGNQRNASGGGHRTHRCSFTGRT
jgi:predicted ATPase